MKRLTVQVQRKSNQSAFCVNCAFHQAWASNPNLVVIAEILPFVCWMCRFLGPSWDQHFAHIRAHFPRRHSPIRICSTAYVRHLGPRRTAQSGQVILHFLSSRDQIKTDASRCVKDSVAMSNTHKANLTSRRSQYDNEYFYCDGNRHSVLLLKWR